MRIKYVQNHFGIYFLSAFCLFLHRKVDFIITIFSHSTEKFKKLGFQIRLKLVKIRMTIAQKRLSLNVLLLTLIVLSIAAAKSPLPIFKNLYIFLKAVISGIIMINIFLHGMLLDLLKIGGSIYLFMVLEKYFLGGPLFTLFIRFFLISDDG